MKKRILITSLVACVIFGITGCTKTTVYRQKLLGKWKVIEVAGRDGLGKSPKYDTYFQIDPSGMFAAIVDKKRRKKVKEGNWFFRYDEFKQQWFQIEHCDRDFDGLYRIVKSNQKEIILRSRWKQVKLERVASSSKKKPYKIGNSNQLVGYWEVYKTKEIESDIFKEKIETAIIFEEGGACYLKKIHNATKVDTGMWWRDNEHLFIQDQSASDTIFFEILSINKDEMVLLPNSKEFRYVFLERFSDAERKEREAVLNGSAEKSNPFKGEHIAWINGYWKTVMEIDGEYARIGGDEFFQFSASNVLVIGKINKNKRRKYVWKYDAENQLLVASKEDGTKVFEATIKLLTKNYLVIKIDDEKYILHRSEAVAE